MHIYLYIYDIYIYHIYIYISVYIYIYICASLCHYHVKFYLLIIMLISVKQHKRWGTVRDMLLNKYPIIIIHAADSEVLTSTIIIKKCGVKGSSK